MSEPGSTWWQPGSSKRTAGPLDGIVCPFIRGPDLARSNSTEHVGFLLMASYLGRYSNTGSPPSGLSVAATRLDVAGLEAAVAIDPSPSGPPSAVLPARVNLPVWYPIVSNLVAGSQVDPLALEAVLSDTGGAVTRASSTDHAELSAASHTVDAKEPSLPAGSTVPDAGHTNVARFLEEISNPTNSTVSVTVVVQTPIIDSIRFRDSFADGRRFSGLLALHLRDAYRHRLVDFVSVDKASDRANKPNFLLRTEITEARGTNHVQARLVFSLLDASTRTVLAREAMNHPWLIAK